MIARTDFIRGVNGCQTCLLLAIVLLLAPLDVRARISEFTAIRDLPKNAIFIDTRPTPACKQQSVSGASCLTPAQLLYPDGHLASFRDINWLLGTLGIDAGKPIVVMGGHAMDRRFVAGVLYLTGLAEITISHSSVAALSDLHGSGQGRQSGILRVSYLDTPMRDQPLLINSDLTILLDTPATRLSTLDKNVWLVRLPHRDQSIVTAIEPRAAIAWFVRLLTTSPAGDQLFVHIDGLSAPVKSRLINLGAEVS